MPGIDASSHNGDPRTLIAAEDWYGYTPSVEAASDVIRTCVTPFVVAVYGRWGRGKTMFMRSIRERLADPGITHHEVLAVAISARNV